MKKITYLALCMVLALGAASCNKEHITDRYDDAIGFSVLPEGSVTRGTPIDAASQIPDMGVFAYYTGNGASTNKWTTDATPNYMYNVKVSHETAPDKWSYSNPVYWPAAADANISFFGYSPFATGVYNASTNPTGNGIEIVSTTGIPVIKYTVPTVCGNQPDLMVSALIADKNKSHTGAVAFEMKHALTCIGFKATSTGADEKVTAIKITGNIVTSGKLTTAADGTFVWSDKTATSNGVFTAKMPATLSALTATEALLNDLDGYLMMIPQDLPADAKLIITVQKGTETPRDVTFNLSGEWKAGDKLNYTFAITPTGIVTVTPQIFLPAAATNSNNVQAIKIDCVPDDGTVAWTLNVPSNAQSWLKLSTSPSTTYNDAGAHTSLSGTGSTTIYAIATENTSTTTPRTTTLTGSGSCVVKQIVKVADGTAGTQIHSTRTYVGAFWRAGQTGERIIRIPAPADNTTWSASVYWMDDRWSSGDIVFATGLTAEELNDRGISFSTVQEPVKTAEECQVENGTSSVSGTVATSGNYIEFRIGLTSTYTATAEHPARYAVVAIAYNSSVQLLFLRQGHDADYVMRINNDYGAGALNSDSRPNAVKFSPYNLTSPTAPAATGTQVDQRSTITGTGGTGGGVFVDYPTQAGAFWQWAGNTGKERYAFHPVNPTGNITGWDPNYPSTFWTSATSPLGATHETCPPGYRRPTDGATNIAVGSTTSTPGNITDSEMRQSLYLNPHTGSSAGTTNTTANNVWGYYADGFFDRRVITESANGTSYPNTTVSKNGSDVAYIGRLFFNPNTKASLFFPASGGRNTSEGTLTNAGRYGYYWSSSASTTANAWILLSPSGNATQSYSSRFHGFPVRCVSQ